MVARPLQQGRTYFLKRRLRPARPDSGWEGDFQHLSGAVGTYWLALPEPGNLTRKCQRNRGSLSPTPAVMGWTSRGVCALG